MTALVQAAAVLHTKQASSNLSIVALFSLVGLTLSLVAAHLGFVAT